MNCPKCQSSEKVTEQNYGALYTCSSCRAVYFIGFDGQPESGEASIEEYELAQNASLSLAQQEYKSAQESVHQAAPQASINFSQSVSGEVESQFKTEPAQLFSDEVSFSKAVSFSDAALDPLVSVTESLEAIPGDSFLSEMISVAEESSEILSDITSNSLPSIVGGSFAEAAREISNFGNTESQIAVMNYDLIVSGIDTQEARTLLKEAIEDSKFGWDASEIMNTMRNGRIELLRLNPVKAFILAKRIQFLDVEKQWKQNVLS